MALNLYSQLRSPQVQDFLREQENTDEQALALKHREVLGIPIHLIAQQISGRRKAKEKLPTWYNTQNIIYPPGVNLEQCSSEATARFKQVLVSELIQDQKNCADLTGGFGVDTYCLSQLFSTMHYVEPNDALFEITAINHELLKASIAHHHMSAEEFLNTTNQQFDLMFIDPSRRNNSRKVFLLKDCIPSVVSLQDKISSLSRYTLVKTSPMLDIREGLKEIKGVLRVVVVAVQNDCKELLFFSGTNYRDEPIYEAVDLFPSGLMQSRFSFTPEEEKKAVIEYSEPLHYLYEPSAALLKSGAFKLIGNRWNLLKLAPNTHLYTSDKLVDHFQGRVFEIQILNPDGKALKHLTGGQANIITRNYPVKPEALKKKLRLKDGGDHYLIGFSTSRRKHLALCSRLTGS